MLALGAIVCGLRDVLKECVFLGYEVGSVLLLYVQFGAQVGLSPQLFVAPLLALRGLLGVGLLVGALLAWMRVR